MNYKFDRKVKETKTQFKKHYSQMTENELCAIKKVMAKININNLNLVPHAREHINLTPKQLRMAFSGYDIIEFNATFRDRMYCRVLIRSKQCIEIVSNSKLIKAQICLVYDLDEKVIVSVYMNEKSDSHDTLNSDRYDKVKINICELMKRY